MIKFFFKWLLRLVFTVVILAVIAVVVFLLSYNSILRHVIEYNIRAQTGMEAEIGRLNVSLAEPTVEIQNLKIYNPTNFAGTPFLDIPEIHIEYDRSALMRRELHVTLLRLNLAELDIVKNQSGQMNVLALNQQIPSPESRPYRSAYGPGSTPTISQSRVPATPPAGLPPATPHPASAPPVVNFQQATGYDFTGIDKLNVSFGREKFIDLQAPSNDFEQTVGLENWIVPHVKSMNDLAGLAVYIDLLSNHFFERVAGGKKSDTVKDVLRSMGLSF